MPGRLIDLSPPEVRLPPHLIIDSSVILDWLSANRAIEESKPLAISQALASQFILRLQSEKVVAFITSISTNEVFHVLIKSKYRSELVNFSPDLTRAYPNVRRHGWEHLFKARSDLMQQFTLGLDEARQLMSASSLLFLQPSDLGDIPSGRSLEDELIRTMARYQLDSSDAAILIEASRAGVTALATADRDLHRAQRDFDVYTWS